MPIYVQVSEEPIDEQERARLRALANSYEERAAQLEAQGKGGAHGYRKSAARYREMAERRVRPVRVPLAELWMGGEEE